MFTLTGFQLRINVRRSAAAEGRDENGGDRQMHHREGNLGVDLATVQKMAGHASASATAGYDRRDRGVQRRAAVLLQVPYTVPED